jgi:hypothetical protein
MYLVSGIFQYFYLSIYPYHDSGTRIGKKSSGSGLIDINSNGAVPQTYTAVDCGNHCSRYYDYCVPDGYSKSL